MSNLSSRSLSSPVRRRLKDPVLERKFPDPSYRLLARAPGLPLVPVTGGTKEPSGIGFIIQSTKYLVEGRLKGRGGEEEPSPTSVHNRLEVYTTDWNIMLFATCFHMIASHVVFCMLSVTCFYLDAISHMLTFFGNCHQKHVVMDADSHMLSCWKLSVTFVMWELSVTCCHGWWHTHVVMNAFSHFCVMLGAVSHILSWMPTVTCGHGCCQSLLCHVGSCQSHIVMDADSHMWSWMLSVTC